MNTCKYTILRSIIVFLYLSLILAPSITAQEPIDDQRGLDLMLVIDNSCSMFSDEDAQEGGCPSGGGNDTNFLRIIGAEIFFRNLNLSDPLSQIGVISFGGDRVDLIHPLGPLQGLSDELTAKVQNLPPIEWTDTGQALQFAYAELERSGRPNNTPAIVLITDGKPELTYNQPYDLSSITSLVDQYSDIPVFVMLVQNNDDLSGDYQEFISFWQQADAQNSHIFYDVIKDQSQIGDAYKKVFTELVGDPPSDPQTLRSNEPIRFFVNEFVQSLRITIIHDDPTERGNITLTDPNGNIVTPDDNDVRFDGHEEIGSVSVIQVGEGYLTPDLRDGYWTIESDVLVNIWLDKRGAYRIGFTHPSVSFTPISNVYNMISPHPISEPLAIRLNLLNRQDGTVLHSNQRQPIYGYVIDEEGNEMDLPIPTDLQPDENGIYELPPYQFPNMSDRELSFYQIVLYAGNAEAQATERIPIANAILRVQVGQFPSLGDVEPAVLDCYPNQSANLSITINNYELADPSSVQVRVFKSGGEDDVSLEQDIANPAVYSGDVASLCTPIISNMSCSTTDSLGMTVSLSARTQTGAPVPMQQKDIPVQTVAPTCPPTITPTPTHTPTPTPTPTPPPPPPDRDGDGGPDGIDSCPTIPGIPGLRYCPSWGLALAILGIIAILFALWKWVIPCLWVRTKWGKPPVAHIRICNKSDKSRPRDYSVYSLGRQHCTGRLKIGGDRKKSHIFVNGLEAPYEFVIEQEGDKVIIWNVKKNTRSTFNERSADPIATSNPDITLYISLDPNKIMKRSC